MATAEEGGATGNTTASSYGGGGAGGKFRKKPFRRPTTPYDRPPTALRANDNNTGWLTKLVVDPASKLISYAAHRFFASVFRKRLPPPPPAQTPEVYHDMSAGLQEAVPNVKNQYGAQEPAGGESTQAINSSTSNGISELEQLLKRKTFTRSEIDHLTGLLQSRSVEVPLGDDGKRNEESASDFGRHQQFASIPLEENRNEGDRSHGVMSTPIFNTKVEDDIGSPAELARAYMGSKPSKVSPSMLGMRSQVSRGDAGLLSNTRFASKSPIMSLTTKSSVSLGAPENGFITPRSRGRSAIYNMSRSPYSRIHPTSTFKGNGINNNDYAGLSMSSSSLSLVEHDARFESKPMSLKRRSSVLDDHVGSVGPIRRIRQKSNLIAPRIPRTAHGVGIGSETVLVPSKQQLSLIGEPNQVSTSVGENVDDSVPSTSYARVPSKSREVAARILQHLEKLSPKEKSSESKLGAKLGAGGERSPFKLTPSMLRGQALRSMEDVGSSKLLLDVQDDHKLENGPNTTLPDARDSTSQKQRKVEENGPRDSFVPSDTRYPLMNNDSAVSLKASGLSIGTSDSVVKHSVTQPPQKKRAFRMSAQEDFLELDDDLLCNGLASRPFSERRGQMETHLTDSKLSSAEGPKLVKTTIHPEVKSPSGLISSKTSEFGSPGAVTVGEGNHDIASPASETATASAQSAVLPLSVAAFDKPKEATNSHSLFSFGPKGADKFSSLPFESSGRVPESKPESSSSLAIVSAPTGSQVKIPESDKGGHLNVLEAGDKNAKSDTIPSAASNGQLVSSLPAVSFAAASSNDTDQIPTGGPLLFTTSTSIANFVPAGTGTSPSVTSSGSIFGSAATPSILAGPVFKFGASVDPSTATSAASTTTIPVGINAEIDPSSGSSSSSLSNVAAFGAASSGSSTFGLSSSVGYSTANDLQVSLFSTASKSLVSGVGTVLQDTSVQSVSSASSPPPININSSTSFGSSFSNSQVFGLNPTFGFSSSPSSSDTGAIVPSGEQTSSVVQFSMSSTAVSNGSAVSSGSGATQGMFSFGFSSSSSSTNAVGSSIGATPPLFSFGGSSSASASLNNTASSFSSGTSGIFNFGGSSSASSSVSSNSAPSNVFGSSWQSPKSSVFGSTFTSASPSTGFSFGALSTSSAPTNAAPIVFNSSTGPSSSPIFSFSTASTPVLSSPPPSLTQSVFGNPPSGFAASPGNNDQMNAEDSMAEDPVQSTAPSVPVFGQSAVSPSPPGFMFGSTVPSQANPFQFGGQQNQVASQNPSPFQASSSQEFNAGGSFSLGSGGGDKSGRKYVKVSRNKNRKK